MYIYIYIVYICRQHNNIFSFFYDSYEQLIYILTHLNATVCPLQKLSNRDALLHTRKISKFLNFFYIGS